MDARDVNAMLLAAQVKAQEIMQEFLREFNREQKDGLAPERMMQMMQQAQEMPDAETDVYSQAG